MAKGNFSNNGRDTFDPSKQYVGIRLQQGVPLLDRDWNELEDIRRYFERTLRRRYIGEGAPDVKGFRVSAPLFHAPSDFMIGAGRFMVDGYDVLNPKAILYSEQLGVPPLPAQQGGAADDLIVYLQPEVLRVDSSDDPDLGNTGDINMETCVRDKLTWRVLVTRHPQQPPAGTVPLAVIHRPAGATILTDEMIEDVRRTQLNLAYAVDEAKALRTEVTAIKDRLDDIELDIVGIKQQLGRLFWDVRLSSTQMQAFFGAAVQLTVTVTDGLGDPASNATVSFATDWGSLKPSAAVTNSKGQATVELVGVHADTPPTHADVGILQGIIYKVNLATLPNPGAIKHAELRFEPQELALISKYSPPSALADLSRNLPSSPIVAIPPQRTATVTVHAQESEGAIVRGVGSIQVHFGMWVRDWAKTKVVDVLSKVHVGARMGSLMAQGRVLEGDQTRFDRNVVVSKLPDAMQKIQDDTQRVFKAAVLVNPEVDDVELTGSGLLGQIIAQEATAVIGQKTNQAIDEQLKSFVADDSIQFGDQDAAVAKTHIVQESSKIAAGFAQNQKQMFSSARFGF